jgi:hypothetical protein
MLNGYSTGSLMGNALQHNHQQRLKMGEFGCNRANMPGKRHLSSRSEIVNGNGHSVKGLFASSTG